MRLSMPMVVQWLKAYNPVATIRSPMATIAGIRHLNNDRDPEPDYIYVGKISDLFPGSVSSEVVLVHRQDVVSLKTAALEEIFDCLSDALVFYQNWEDELMSVVRQKNPYQFLINASEKLLGNMFFANTRLQIVAASFSLSDDELQNIWKNFWETGRWKCDCQENIPFAQVFERVWDKPLQIYDIRKGNCPWASIISQTDGQGRLLGQMILLQKQPTAQYQRPLLAMLAHALEYSGLYADAEQDFSVENSLVREILEVPQQNGGRGELLLRIRQWDENVQTLVIILRRKEQNDRNSLECLEYFRRQQKEGMFILAYPEELGREEVIVCLLAVRDMDPDNISEEDARVRLKTLFTDADRAGFTVHISYHHAGIACAHLQYRQALVAASSRKRYFYNCALNMLTSFAYDRELCMFSLHPVPGKIQDYDKEHGTEYYQMLQTYLRCERNRNETARRLYVHKNTLAYRLQKIEELFHLNLDDTYEREFLLLTMAVLSQQGEYKKKETDYGRTVQND